MLLILRITVGLTVGAISGALIGGAMLAIPDLFNEGCGPLGCVKDWAIVGFYIGSLLGGVTGAIIGLVVGLTSPIKAKALMIGAGVGSIITVTLLIMGAADDAVVFGWAMLPIPAGAFIGFITATCAAMLPRQVKRTAE